MLFTLLTSELPEGGRYVSVGDASLYALIGFLVVFAGIALLIGVVWSIGKLMSMKTPVKKQEKPSVKTESKPVAAAPKQDEVDEETAAVIMAALTAYYQTNNPSCGFVVKRIKRI